MSEPRQVRIIITGGGTGGHTTPAIAVIQSLKTLALQEHLELRLLYVGSMSGVEEKSAREIGVEFWGIETGKLRRSKSVVGMLNRQNLSDLMRVPVGFLQAVRTVSRFRPDVVFSTGGYVSVPGVLASGICGVPVVAHEQTVQIGLANKINFRFAKRIALSVVDSVPLLTQSQMERAVVTGNPIRSIVFGGDATLAANKFGFRQDDSILPTVYITGGAQGSHLINKAIGACLPKLLTMARVIHQCGIQIGQELQDKQYLQELANELEPQLKLRYAPVEQIGGEIGDVYALADVIVGRSGAGTVSEICALGKASVLVPLVPTGGDEQTKNAQRLEAIGATKTVKQEDCSSETLLAALMPLLSSSNLRFDMGNRARTLANAGADERLAKLVLVTAGAIPEEYDLSN